ncbi:MAG: hypothetical protein OXC07_07900 [Kistimonas sp.]|nr:hypothetical protein [Kistimonas sp.]
MDEKTVKQLALIITANCLRNTAVEKVRQQALSDPLSERDLQHLHKAMSDRMYTFLTYLLGKPAREYAALMEELTRHYPTDWPMPELDSTLVQIVGDNTQEHMLGGLRA